MGWIDVFCCVPPDAEKANTSSTVIIRRRNIARDQSRFIASDKARGVPECKSLKQECEYPRLPKHLRQTGKKRYGSEPACGKPSLKTR